MKKFLLTASMLVMGVVATFAQNVPDASKWTVGQEVEGVIQNPSFTIPADQGVVWKYTDAPSPNVDVGLFESWNSGSKTTVFQYVLLPKGKYRVTCQGYYRGGGEDQDTDNFINYDSQWQDNASLFVQNGEYDSSKDVFKGGHIFKNPLMPRLFELVENQIYFGVEGDADWAIDHSHEVGGKTVWGPGGVNGSLAWFAEGKYNPYEKDDVVYNIVDFFLAKDGYVKLGAMKTGEQSGGDTFFVTNFKLYYNGAVGEDDVLMITQSDCDDLLNELHEMRDDENNKGLLAGKLDDALMMFEQIEYGSDPYEFDLETATKAKEVLEELKENAMIALNDMTSLKNAIKAIEVLTSTTDYPGKTALNTALETAKASMSDNYVYEGEEDWDTYGKLAEALYAARVDYLKSSPKTETGAWDFSPFIANRFFTNEENNPTWDEETNFWKYENWPEAWSDMEFSGDNQDHKDARTAYSGDVVLSSSDDTVPFKWYKTGSEGPGWEVYYDHHMTSCKAWALTPTKGISVIGQYLTGLPNGFYSLTGMMETWTNDDAASGDMHFIIRSANQSQRSERAEPRGWWNGNTIDSWCTLSTDMVEVTDGNLWVEASVNGFYSVTGFQLFYYGETPDFNAMIQPSLNSAKEAAKALTFEGDKKKVQEMLAKVPASVDSKEVYLASTEAIAEANEYINTANNAINNWKALENFPKLGEKYEEGTPEKDIINTALAGTMEVGENADDTYEDAIANEQQYNAYLAYMTYRESIGEFIKDAAVAPIIEEQNTYLKANFATVEKLDEFKLAIGVEYNKAKFAAEGIDKATLNDPKSVTFLLINPSFDEGCEKGWTVVGTGAANNNEYSFDENGNRTNAELWNRPEFTFSQVVSGLPAGTYEFRARALYRDGGGVSKESVDKYNAAGGEENWENHNAVLFAKSSDNEWNSYLKAIQSLKATENSFTQCGTAWEYDAEDKVNYVKTISYMAGTIDEADQKEDVKYNSVNEGSYPLDVKVTYTDEETLDEVNYYYPSSMQGFYAACKKDPNAYANSVIFYISESSNIELGIKKKVAIGNDWVIMDDFELYYLGKEAPVAIEEVAGNAAAQGAVEYYSVNGVKLNAPQAGLNIVKYANGEVRKVFINK